MERTINALVPYGTEAFQAIEEIRQFDPEAAEALIAQGQKQWGRRRLEWISRIGHVASLVGPKHLISVSRLATSVGPERLERLVNRVLEEEFTEKEQKMTLSQMEDLRFVTQPASLIDWLADNYCFLHLGKLKKITDVIQEETSGTRRRANAYMGVAVRDVLAHGFDPELYTRAALRVGSMMYGGAEADKNRLRRTILAAREMGGIGLENAALTLAGVGTYQQEAKLYALDGALTAVRTFPDHEASILRLGSLMMRKKRNSVRFYYFMIDCTSFEVSQDQFKGFMETALGLQQKIGLAVASKYVRHIGRLVRRDMVGLAHELSEGVRRSGDTRKYLADEVFSITEHLHSHHRWWGWKDCKFMRDYYVPADETPEKQL